VARSFARRRLLRDRLRSRGTANGNGRGRSRAGQILLALAGAMFVLFAITGATGYGVYRSYANDLLPPDEMIARQPSGGAQIYDRNGTLLYEFVDDRSGLRSPIKLEEVSPWLIAATISTEDWSFWSNEGVNLKGLARAGLERAGIIEPRGATSTGGSSITQQLVKNVYIPVEERGERSYRRKLKETIYALELTRDYSKDQILEWYLNQISYGNIYNGVEAASLGVENDTCVGRTPADDVIATTYSIVAGVFPAAFDDTITAPSKSQVETFPYLAPAR